MLRLERLSEEEDTLEQEKRELELEGVNLDAQLKALTESGKEIEQNTARNERELESIRKDCENAEKMSRQARCRDRLSLCGAIKAAR